MRGHLRLLPTTKCKTHPSSPEFHHQSADRWLQTGRKFRIVLRKVLPQSAEGELSGVGWLEESELFLLCLKHGHP